MNELNCNYAPDEVPSVVNGQLFVPWSSDYFWCLLPWGYCSFDESKILCGYLESIGIHKLYLCKKQVYSQQERDFIVVSTNNHEEFLSTVNGFLSEEFLILDPDLSILFYCNGAADLLAIRFSRGQDMQGALSKLLDTDSGGR